MQNRRTDTSTGSTELKERLVFVNRVAKVAKGGKNFPLHRAHRRRR